MRSVEDLHTRARIRNAAVARFGQDGFDVGLRAIAADAGVSPALIVHHFGSKAGLRDACDGHVMQVITEAKLESVGAGGPEYMLAQLAAVDEYAPAAAYSVASLAAGGPFARRLFDQMVEMSRDFLETGVRAGTLKPSRDPRARAHYLTQSGLGQLLLAYRLREQAGEPMDLRQVFAELTDQIMLPALELYTDGLFADDSYLRAYEAGTTPAADTDHRGEER